MPQMKATPAKHEGLAWLMSKLQGADEFARKPFGYDNPPVAILSDLLGIPGVLKTGERIAYDEPVTTGRGWTTRMKPETEEALMAAPMLMDMPLSPLRALATLPRSVARAAGDFARASAIPATNVVKAKGGNWLAGSVEKALEGLKRGPLDGGRNLIERGLTTPEAMAKNPDVALNSWIDKQLTRYVKNEMATPEDPIRALAERGILHRGVNPHYPTRPSLGNRVNREHAGFDPEGMAQSDLAKYWENVSDNSVRPSKAHEFLDDYVDPTAEVSPWLAKNPWLEKVPPETPVHEIYSTGGNLNSDAGFSHLIDELRNATNPASGLPRELLLKYESLPQVSVPQAVERVSQINAWRAAQKAEADAAKANNAATVLHKEYPEKGFKWVELKAPEDEAAFASGARAALDPTTGDMRGAGYKALEDALKYEGDTMGHCVGGYCPDVLEGKSRIFSLRSAKGEPHVTIEVAPGDVPAAQNRWAMNNPELYEQFKQEAGDLVSQDKLWRERYMSEVPQRIVQIKGKANRAPNPEYLPFVQDFVRSGKWSDVGDLENAGLRRTRDVLNDLERKTLADKGHVFSDYMSEQERQGLQALWDENRAKGGQGFAAGGVVTASQTGYNPQRVDELVNSLSAELFPQ